MSRKIAVNSPKSSKVQKFEVFKKVPEKAISRQFHAKLPRKSGAPAGIRTPDVAAGGIRTLIRFAQKTLRVLVSVGSNQTSTNSKNAPSTYGGQCISGAPAGIRTPDTLLKRQVLCLLSYWGGFLAGMAGLEPTISESKSGVLPLHYIPICLSK